MSWTPEWHRIIIRNEKKPVRGSRGELSTFEKMNESMGLPFFEKVHEQYTF